jgi:hypothetical protein
MTGQEFYAYFRQKVDLSYTNYLDPIKANRIIRNGMFLATDTKNLTLQEQKVFDEIAALIMTQKVFSVNNNQISIAPLLITNITFAGAFATVTTLYPHNLINGDTVTISGVQGNVVPTPNGTATVINTPTTTSFTFAHIYASGAYTANTGQVVFSKMIADYMHLYSVKCKFEETQYGLKVNATNGVSPITITLSQRNKFRNSSVINLSGMTATPSANGTWYYKYLNTTSGQLYTDEDLQTPSTGGTNSTTQQGVVKYIWYEFAKPLVSTQKIDAFEKNLNTYGSADLPMYETANKMLRFFPSNRACTEITVDYIAIPTVQIDCTDNTFNLSLVYPDKYLYYLIDVVARLLSMPTRDQLLNAEASQELAINP